MIDANALKAALKAAMLAHPDLGAQNNDSLDAFAEVLAQVIAEFCAPAEE